MISLERGINDMTKVKLSPNIIKGLLDATISSAVSGGMKPLNANGYYTETQKSVAAAIGLQIIRSTYNRVGRSFEKNHPELAVMVQETESLIDMDKAIGVYTESIERSLRIPYPKRKDVYSYYKILTSTEEAATPSPTENICADTINKKIESWSSLLNENEPR